MRKILRRGAIGKHTMICGVLVSLMVLVSCSVRSQTDPVVYLRSGPVEHSLSPYLQREWNRVLNGIARGTLKDGLKRASILEDGFPLMPKLSNSQWARLVLVDPRKINFIKRDGMFICGDQHNRVVGCFIAPNTIYFYRDFPGAVYHEIAHLMLYTVGDKRWRCSLHDYNFNGRWDCFE